MASSPLLGLLTVSALERAATRRREKRVEEEDRTEWCRSSMCCLILLGWKLRIGVWGGLGRFLYRGHFY